MKKLLILTVMGAMLAMPATAVEKCIAMLQGYTECMATSQGDYYTKWSGTCSTDGRNSVVSGLGLCSTYGSSSSPRQGAPLGSGTNCWCKMLKPARSQWVFAYTATDVGTCQKGCGAGCGAYMGLDNYVDQILSTVSN